jgi:hypothetical protein
MLPRQLLSDFSGGGALEGVFGGLCHGHIAVGKQSDRIFATVPAYQPAASREKPRPGRPQGEIRINVGSCSGCSLESCMRNRGITTVTKVYIGVGVFITLVLMMVVIRVVGGNMNPDDHITRQDPNIPENTTPIPREPAGSASSELEQNHNNITPNSSDLPAGENSGAAQ